MKVVVDRPSLGCVVGGATPYTVKNRTLRELDQARTLALSDPTNKKVTKAFAQVHEAIKADRSFAPDDDYPSANLFEALTHPTSAGQSTSRVVADYLADGYSYEVKK